jgi:hypothetical protein
LTIASGSFLERLMMINISLVLFNLIPAFPMDGGRVLRAFLAMRMDYVRATQIAATIGQGMALLFGLIGLFGNASLLFIAFFIWIGASQEAGMTQMKNAIARMSQLILSGSQHDFPVIDNDRVVGVVTRDDFIMALTQHGEGIAISAVMKKDLPEVDSYEMVENALMRIQESGVPALPVTHAGQLVGIVTAENITEYLMIRSALKRAALTS